MSQNFQQGTILECKSAETFSRKFTPKGPVKENPLGYISWRFTGDRDCLSTILKELDINETKYPNNLSILRNQGDFIKGKSIDLIIKSRKSPKKIKVSHQSHTHGSEKIKSSQHTIAKLTRGFENILQKRKLLDSMTKIEIPSLNK